jgi:Calcineurin-like phosphoesterase
MNCYLFVITLLFFIILPITSLTYGEENGYYYYDDDYNDNNYNNLQQNSITENKPFNIAVAGDWGCKKDAEKTVENILDKNPELVIANGDLSYDESAECWFEVIQPLKSKMNIAMGDHEYSETSGGIIGIIDQYLKPLNLERTYYSLNLNNVHVIFMDPYLDYTPGSSQFHFIVNDLKTASADPEIDWIFVVESIPIYTSPAQHEADYSIRDIYHPFFDKYGVDLVFSSDNHNYQRTFPLKYNSEDKDSSNYPLIVDRNSNNYFYYDDIYDNGVIYLIIGTAGRSLYEIKEQAPFVAKQDDKHFGFLNIDINGKTLKGTFFANENELPYYYYIDYQDNVIDHFTISKESEQYNNKEFTTRT